TRRPRTNTTTATAPHDTRPTNTTTPHDPHPSNTRAGTTATHDPHPNNSNAGTSAGGTGARIELRITDRPPPSDPDRYTPSAALDRYVRWRDRTCQFPGCNRPAEFTDLDHRMAFAAGGRTTAANSWCLCRHHHRLKHEGGWEIAANPDGSWTWTSPTGRSYHNNPTTIDPPGPAQPATSPDAAEPSSPPGCA
ncbi:HNH endonuclease signature motif containing protein, partial [Kribbella sp. NPDC006257]|uniref:HNH endonuclease signature motif containing protein n=1 Tax=Kribbella sp. NPDC006257 TaxID=3156738 RepID=UPI0033AA89CD